MYYELTEKEREDKAVDDFLYSVYKCLNLIP